VSVFGIVFDLTILQEVLDKLRTGFRVARHNMPRSSVQQQLGQLSTWNKDLVRLMNDQLLEPGLKSTDEPQPTQFLLRDCHEAVEIYNVIREGYDCECDEPHITNFDLHCPAHTALVTVPDIQSYKWKFELVIPPKQRRESTTSLLSVPSTDTAVDKHESQERYLLSSM